MQTEDFLDRENLFTADYAYLSGASASWRKHVRKFSREISAEYGLSTRSLVLEVASNDGTLLECFDELGFRVLGIEPTRSTSSISIAKGLPTIESFFGRNLTSRIVEDFGRADLVVANNVIAHVPDIRDFLTGVSEVLQSDGIATFEFPHLLELIDGNQFDTIYHEHFSYLSLTAFENFLEDSGLRAFRVDRLETHGGSLRVYATLEASGIREERSVAVVRNLERDRGITDPSVYSGLQSAADNCASEFLGFLEQQRDEGKLVIGYGAAAKGNTLMNFAGVTRDLIPVIIDKSPLKQGKYTPGSHIPIRPFDFLRSISPDTIVVLPWNLRNEIVGELAEIGLVNVKICTAIPILRVE